MTADSASTTNQESPHAVTYRLLHVFYGKDGVERSENALNELAAAGFRVVAGDKDLLILERRAPVPC